MNLLGDLFIFDISFFIVVWKASFTFLNFIISQSCPQKPLNRGVVAGGVLI